MSRSNFRIKVDLSRYYQDIRQLCWIFIDGTKILLISDLKKHINKLFNISDPYHLCLNNREYLPPFEDARIVKENETIIVIPGSGLDNEVESIMNAVSASVQDKNISSEKKNITWNHKEMQSVKCVEEVTTVPTKENELLRTDEISDLKNDLSSTDITFHSIINDTEDNCSTDSKTMNSTITENYSPLEKKETSNGKRKRVRRRKEKKNKDISNVTIDVNDDNTQEKKPKVVDSLVLSSEKHIRFNINEINENLQNQQCAIEPTLSKLFDLRNSSTPFTFHNKKKQEEINAQTIISDVEKVDTNVINEKENDSLNNNIDKNTSNIESNHSIKKKKFFDIDPKNYVPVKTHEIQNLDIIAFQMLTIGSNYTPEVSKTIVAQVISCDHRFCLLSLRVIKGMDQIYDDEVPVGKFNNSKEEINTDKSIISNLHYSKIINPYIIKGLH